MWDFLQVSFGTASVVALIYAVWPNIVHQDVKYRKEAWFVLGAFLLSTAVLYLWSPSGIASPLKQTDTLLISGRSDELFQVFYPRAYERSPSLKVKFTKGQGTIELAEQLPVGFRFKVRDVSYTSEGAEIEWAASGIAAK